MNTIYLNLRILSYQELNAPYSDETSGPLTQRTPGESLVHLVSPVLSESLEYNDAVFAVTLHLPNLTDHGEALL